MFVVYKFVFNNILNNIIFELFLHLLGHMKDDLLLHKELSNRYGL